MVDSEQISRKTDPRGAEFSMPRFMSKLLVLAVGISVTGCSRDRASMRPIYVGPSVPVQDTTVIPEEGGTRIIQGPEEPASAPSKTPMKSDEEPALDPTKLKESTQEQDSSGLKAVPEDPPAPTPKIESPVGLKGAKARTALGKSRVQDAKTRVLAFVDDPTDLLQPPKADRNWKYIVLHHSANDTGGYASIDHKHREELGWTGCGYHFVVGNGSESPDGQIEVAARWADQKQGAHCRDGKFGDLNEYGIGICLIGNFEESGPTTKQIQAAAALVDYLKIRYAIPADRIGTHENMAAGSIACPGKYFPKKQILGANRMAFASKTTNGSL